MRGTITFNKTVIGYKHIQKNIPCEDYSDSFSDEFGLYDIAIIADGHGDPACFRSKIGSMMAVNTAMLCLKEFACCWSNDLGSFRNNMHSQRERSNMIKNLTDVIISQWYEKIYEDLSNNPISEEEYLLGEKMADIYRSGERVEHIYGTTFMAALRLADYLILLHQGDGRCVVFYENGSVDQPIPWDDRCQENVTTSMCDQDVAVSIRNCVIELSEKKVAACYLGSDGVEDSYRNMEGTHLFYQQLSCDLMEYNFESFDTFLEEKLTTLSREGSADDVSVAGIISPKAIKDLLEKFKINIRNYNLLEERQVLESKLFSMERKHTVLYKRCIEHQKQQTAYNIQISAFEEKVKVISQEIETLKSKLYSASEALDNNEARQEAGVLQKIKDFFVEQEIETIRLQKELSVKEAELSRISDELGDFEAVNFAAKEKWEKELMEFEEYDTLYKKIIAQINAINDKIDENTAENALKGVQDE